MNEAPEAHPLAFFLPANARVLLLGSFPPPQKRWSMDFFYPNFNNDMWRVFGLLFFGDAAHFVVPGAKKFDRAALVAFLEATGVALGDTARAVVRQKDNASDAFLEIVQPTDVRAILAQLPLCRAVAATGQKACEALCAQFGVAPPAMGAFVNAAADRELRLYRMPSTSRAYPLALAKKADAYARLFRDALGVEDARRARSAD